MGEVFISYSHDSPEHSERVLALSNRLLALGVDTELDRYHVRPQLGWPHWCEEQLRPQTSSFVLLICTPTYRARIENRVAADEGRGVYWEGAILYNYLYNAKGNLRFIPVLLDDAPEASIPMPLDGQTRYQLRAFELTDPNFEALYRELTGQPATPKPRLGNVVRLDATSALQVAKALPEKEARWVVASAGRPAKRSVQIAHNPQVPWTDEQWASAKRMIEEELNRADLAATYLPVVQLDPPDARRAIEDTVTPRLATLQVKLFASGAEMADPTRILRDAANALARLEDAVVFGGLVASDPPAPPFAPPNVFGLPPIWEILDGEISEGILGSPTERSRITILTHGASLVRSVTEAIGRLEDSGHYSPFMMVLDNYLFAVAQTPNFASLVPPKEQFTSLLGDGGRLLRSPFLSNGQGVIVALGGAPIEIIATNASLDVQRVSDEPEFAVRIFEKMRLRIVRPEAIIRFREAAASP